MSDRAQVVSPQLAYSDQREAMRRSYGGAMNDPRLLPVTNPGPELEAYIERVGLRGPDGTPLNIFGTLARHPALLRRWMPLAGHVMSKNSLSARDRELLILRTGHRCASLYEFSQHAQIALDCDMTADEVAAVRDAVDHPRWTPTEQLLLRAADELHDQQRISDTTWAALSAEYSEQQLIDIVFTVGQYTMVAMFLNTSGVQLDPGVDAAW